MQRVWASLPHQHSSAASDLCSYCWFYAFLELLLISGNPTALCTEENTRAFCVVHLEFLFSSAVIPRFQFLGFSSPGQLNRAKSQTVVTQKCPLWFIMDRTVQRSFTQKLSIISSSVFCLFPTLSCPLGMWEFCEANYMWFLASLWRTVVTAIIGGKKKNFDVLFYLSLFCDRAVGANSWMLHWIDLCGC